MNGEEMKLEPCPWCGSTNIETELDDALGRKWGFAVCCDCSTRGPDVRTGYDEGSQAAWRVEAVAMWNTRAPINRPSPEAGESGKQPFERYPALASWIERLANTNMDLPLGDWMVFVGALNMTLARLEAELAEARKERDEARSGERNMSEHVRTVSLEATDGFAALDALDKFWDAVGYPGNRGKLTPAEQVASIYRERDQAEAQRDAALEALRKWKLAVQTDTDPGRPPLWRIDPVYIREAFDLTHQALASLSPAKDDTHD